MNQLPKGYYAVVSDFENAPKDVFTFRGETYAVTEGVNLFGSVIDANAAATECPEVILEGLPYDELPAPVLLLSKGKHRIDKLMIEDSRILLGEKVGVSPSLAERVGDEPPLRNPDRCEIAEESILYGGYWYGVIRVTGAAVPLVILDGFTMEKSRFADGRTKGDCDTRIILRNLYHTSPCLHNVYVFENPHPDTPMHRSILFENVRLEKDFDELGYGRIFTVFMSNEITFRGLCIDGTTQLFGFSSIPRLTKNCARNTPVTTATFEDSYVRGLCGENGICFSLPGEKDHGFVLRAVNSTFVNASIENEAAFSAGLENELCRISLENCRIVDTRGNKGAAVAVYGGGKNVSLTGCSVEGYASEVAMIAAPPSDAPAHVTVKERAYTTKTSDPHRVLGRGKIDPSAIDAYYAGCRAYYGDLHTHSNAGGTSDGKTLLSDWVARMDEVGLDFAAMVDHRQMRGFFLPEWDDTRFLYGTEPGSSFTDLAHLPNNTFHYNMIFPHKYGLAMVLANFPEFQFSGDELTGSFRYPNFTKERFMELNDYIRSIGGILVHAHPKLLLASNDPLDYYAGEHSYLETIVNAYSAPGAFRSCDLWDKILKTGKHMYASGGSDTHSTVTNGCPSTFYTEKRYHKDFIDRMYAGDFTVGGVGVRMMIDGHPMGSELTYRKGMTLTLRVGDFHPATFRENTAYELQILTDKGVAYSSLFSGKETQELALLCEDRMYYRVEIWDRTRGYRVAVSNPIWLDGAKRSEA